MSAHRTILYFTAVFVAGFSPATSQHSDSLRARLQIEHVLAGWAPVDTSRVYSGRDLFTFIDGGADLFFEYGFRQAQALEYKHDGAESIMLEIYQMNDPAASFGIYSVRSAQEGRLVTIGDEGSSYPYYLMFWRGAYYVSVAASDSSETCRNGMEEVARAVDGEIRERGERPAVVGLLPRDGILKARYTRGPLGLLSARTLDMKELFPIADAAIGTYANHTILLMRYTKAADAKMRLESVKRVLEAGGEYTECRTEGAFSTAVHRKDQTVCFAQEGLYLIISVSATDTIARRVCGELASSLRDKKN
jgi:hypothetical protein